MGTVGEGCWLALVKNQLVALDQTWQDHLWGDFFSFFLPFEILTPCSSGQELVSKDRDFPVTLLAVPVPIMPRSSHNYLENDALNGSYVIGLTLHSFIRDVGGIVPYELLMHLIPTDQDRAHPDSHPLLYNGFDVSLATRTCVSSARNSILVFHL